MLKHDFFEELCALAASGQLTPEEQSQLTEHLTDCEYCREACEEFAAIFNELPCAQNAPAEQRILRGVDVSGLRKGFLERVPWEGHRFSEEAQRAIAGRSWTLPQFLIQHQWVAASLLIGILLGALSYKTLLLLHQESGVSVAPTAASVGVDSQGIGKEETARPGATELQTVDGAYQKTISSLKAKNAALAVRLTAIEGRLAASESKKQNLEQSMTRVNESNSELSTKMEQNAQAMALTRAELEKARSDRESMVSELSAQKTEVSMLSEQLRVQNASLDQERQLLAAGRDITDLMGARSLHMIDVHDAVGDGKDRKSFGRIFYTEGKSLIFYAFDLDEKKLADAHYQFAAWGEQLGRPSSVKSLGILYGDDKAQRRWVLKVDDPRQIAQIDSVFVTLEPHDGNGAMPRGKRILYAFLGGAPNHP